MKKLLIALLGTSALAACGGETGESPARDADPAAQAASAPSAAAVAAGTDRINAWFDQKWQEELDFSPLFKTYLGLKEDNDKIDDFSEAGEEALLYWRRTAGAEMRETFDYDLLTPAAQTSYDIFEYQLAQAEAAAPFRRRSYVFNQMRGPHTQLPNFLINFHKVEDASDMEAYVARLSGAARALGQALDRAKLAAGEGVHAPTFAYEAVIEQATALTTGEPFDGPGEAPLYVDLKKKLAALVEAGELDETTAAALRTRAEEAMVSELKPAYDAIVAFAEADLENSPEIATGVGSLPDGEAYYEERLAFSTTTEMTPDEVHELGLAEVARIRGDMEALKERVGFEGSLEAFFEFVREDERFYYPDTDEGREEYLQAARDRLGEIEAKLPQYFGVLPQADLIVKRVEAFRERDGGAQHYFPATPDGSRPGVFYAHLSDMSAMPIPQLEVIAYHEGNPGHHLQNSIRQEVEGLPDFRAQASFTAYGEGWALYSELLAKEMGAYEDPYSDFGRMTTEIWRAIRLVVDTGLHSKGWTEAEAIDYFTENSPAAAGQIKSEVQRYIVMPGQATSYKVGMIKILQLRARAREALGSEFDIRTFHDVVLSGGELPMALLDARVDAWIAGQSAAG
ncbi:MAG: DUF885 family protein [Parvularculaceae bacterium]